jgi:hypothetical protein
MCSARVVTSAAHHGFRFLLPPTNKTACEVRPAIVIRLSLLLLPVLSLCHHTAPPHATRKQKSSILKFLVLSSRSDREPRRPPTLARNGGGGVVGGGRHTQGAIDGVAVGIHGGQ